MRVLRRNLSTHTVCSGRPGNLGLGPFLMTSSKKKEQRDLRFESQNIYRRLQHGDKESLYMRFSADELAVLCAKEGDLHSLKTLLDDCGAIPPDNIIYSALESNRIDCVYYLLTRGYRFEKRDINYALIRCAENGYLSLVEYLHHRGANLRAVNCFALHLAVKEGHYNVVKYICRHISVDRSTLLSLPLTEAKAKGHDDIVEFLTCLYDEIEE